MPECWPCSGDSPWNCGLPGVLRYGAVRIVRTSRDGIAWRQEYSCASCPGCGRYPDAKAATAAWEAARREKEEKP